MSILSDIFSGKIGSLFRHKKEARPTPPPEATYNLPDRGVTFTDKQFNAIRPIIYGEVSNRPYAKKELEANVIMNTIFNRAREYKRYNHNKSISDVVAVPNQYQAYGGKQYKNYSNPTLYLDQKKKKEVDMIMNKIHNQIKMGQFRDNTKGSYYYQHNPNNTISYDNKRQLFAQ